MKKLKALLALCLIVVIVGGAYAFKKKTTDDFKALRPYVTKDVVMYFDPLSLYASIRTSAGTPPPSAMQPMMIHSMKLENVSFDQIDHILRKQLTVKDHWHFSPMPGGLSSTSSSGSGTIPSMQMISAYQGATPSPVMAEPEHMIMVMPSGFGTPVFVNGKMTMGKPKSFTLMEMRKLATWEIYWLKAKNLGRDPYAKEQDLMNIYSP